MAESPSHRFGQILGEVLEAAILPVLEKFAKDHKLYLDKHGARACRNGTTCTWLDSNGNTHGLDFVLERGGTPEKISVRYNNGDSINGTFKDKETAVAFLKTYE